jgi:predicted DNA-binding WGR domain protein
MKKHLKYIDGNSDKFWQIEVSGINFTVTYGKNGTLGVSQIKTFANAEECLKAAEKLLAEKTKKGYSESGEVTVSKKIDPKTGKVSNIDEILKEYDSIIKQKNTELLLPFLIKNAKGNLEPIRKHINKNKRYWMTFIDLALEPGYIKTNKNWDWGMRGDEKTKEIITLSAIALYDKTAILSFDEALRFLEKANDPNILEILLWAKPNWIEFYLLDKFKKSEWINFDYKSLRFLEENNFLNFNPELFALCLSRFNSWSGKTKPRDFIDFLSKDKIAYERDIPLLYNYETNIQNSTFRENENASYRECNTWSIAIQLLLTENKLDKKIFFENAILIQTKEWNNNLKLFFRKIIEDLRPSSDELIPFQENIFTFFNNSNPTITNYGSDLIKKIYVHPKFKTKSYLEWLEGLMMRSDCKAAIKNSLIILEKISKNNPKFNKSIAVLIADIYVVSDLSLQERTTKLILKIGNSKDAVLREKLSTMASYMQGTVKSSLGDFLNEETLIVDESSFESYEFNPKKAQLLVEEVKIPKDWNDVLFLYGRFISSEEIIDSEILLNVFITQRELFPSDYSEQLQPYLKQLEKTYTDSVLKNYTKNLLINKVSNKNFVYKLNDSKYLTLKTLRSIKPIIEKLMQKNNVQSILPLLSFPTHKPHWVAPKILLERMIAYQNSNEAIDPVDLSIAINRMPRENVTEAIPLLDQLDPDMKSLMSFCLGISKEININSGSIITKLFQKVGGSTPNTEKIGLWAVAARTFYPTETFLEFEKTYLSDVPFVIAPYVPKVTFKEKWNEWKDYKTKELVRSPSWTELRIELPNDKTIPNYLLYSLDINEKVEKNVWSNDYKINSAENVYYWNSLMPQNNDSLAINLLDKSCRITDGTNNELKGFLNIVNHAGFQFSDTSLLLFSCCFFQEKKDIRLLASEVLINLVENQSIDISLFAEKSAYLISNKYGVLLRFIEAISALKDISVLNNSALFLLIDGIFENIELQEKLPTNFKKMVENYLDMMLKTNQKPAEATKAFFEKLKENKALKVLIKKILDEQ